MAKTIDVTTQYIDLEGGFWGLVDHSGNQYEPENLPSELQKEGLKARIQVRVSNAASMRMWGQVVRVLKVETVY